MKLLLSVPLCFFMALSVLTGCRQEQVDSAASEAERSAREAGEQIREQAGPALERTKEQGQQAARQAEKSLEAGGVTLRVKTALAASTRLDVSGINVDTKGQAVHLRGSVTDERQKSLAEQIAKNTVGTGVTVVNELRVLPPGGPKSIP